MVFVEGGLISPINPLASRRLNVNGLTVGRVFSLVCWILGSSIDGLKLKLGRYFREGCHFPGYLLPDIIAEQAASFLRLYSFNIDLIRVSRYSHFVWPSVVLRSGLLTLV